MLALKLKSLLFICLFVCLFVCLFSGLYYEALGIANYTESKAATEEV
jgi:hypothetical protein